MANRAIIRIITITAECNFASYLTKKLKKNDMSPRELAKATGISATAIYDYLNGYRSPKLDTLAVIFDHFGDTEIKISLKEPNNT